MAEWKDLPIHDCKYRRRTDLTTKTAQSLHAEWCEQMRKKGRHGPREHCDYCEIMQHTVYGGNCNYFDASICAWPDLPESRRQEYLSTAKAVLPEIVGEVFDEAWQIAVSYDQKAAWNGAPIAIANEIDLLRDRRLEELKNG